MRNKCTLPGGVVHVYNPSIQEIEAGGMLQAQGQPGLHSRTLSQNTELI